MLDLIRARFKENAVLVSPGHSGSFEGCMSALAKLPELNQMLAANANGDDFWPQPGDWRAAYRPYLVKDGILTIPVKGVLLHDFLWQASSYATGYKYIEKALERGLSDGSVRGIILHLHTPGGDVAGCFELVDKIYAARKLKPIRAFAHEAAYSAGYAIASAAGKIVVSRTGGVGSIGVVTAHVDMSKMLEDAGYKITFVHFGEHKVDGNAYTPLPDAVKQRMQTRIDNLGEIFVASVARNRQMDVQAVKDTEALTYSADEALSIGLADSIGPMDDALAEFSADLSNTEGEEQMADFTQAQHDEAVAAATAAATATATATALKAGAEGERARVNAILTCDAAKKRPKAALSAVKAGMTVEQATEFLADLDEEKAPAATNNTQQNFDNAMTENAPGITAGDEGAKPSRASATLSAMGLEKKKT